MKLVLLSFILIKVSNIMKNFKLILKSLISNEACVEGGRHRPWWIALILFFFSTIVAIVPVFVQTITKAGSSFVSTNSYGIENGLQRFVEDVKTHDELTMVIKTTSDGEKYLNLDQEKWDKVYTYTNKDGFNAYQHKNESGVVDLDVFYIADFANDGTAKDAASKIASDKAVVNEETGETTYTKRSTSFVIFGKDLFVVYLYNGTSTTLQGSVIGDYKSIDDGFNFVSLLTVKINDKEVTNDTVTPEEYSEYRKGVWTNWKDYFDKAYLYNRSQLTWQTTLLMFGINAGLVIFMGFMIWVLTRGKNNPYKIYKFYECEFIAAWAGLTPGLLTCGFGFLLSSFANVMFPLLLGVRVMWLSMKTLRPQYNYAPQQNQKKVDKVKTVDVKSKKK